MKKSRFLLLWTFFGLSDKYQEQVYEQFFLLKYHGNWNLQEAFNLPVGLRMWFMNRLVKQLEDEAQQRKDGEKKK